MIRQEQLRDLRVGDVVEFSTGEWLGAIVRGTVYKRNGVLLVGPVQLRDEKVPGYSFSWAAASSAYLTVVSRPRAEPCRTNVNSYPVGAACENCGHTSLVHPHVGNLGVDHCVLCELEIAIRRVEGTS